MDIMSKEMGEMGPFIVKKQCEQLGLDCDDINEGDVPKLARALSETMRSFGQDRAKKVYSEIRRTCEINEIVDAGKVSEEQLETLLNMGDAARFAAETDDALGYYGKLLKHADKAGALRYQTMGRCMMGFLFVDLNDAESAMAEFQRALEHGMEWGDDLGLAHCHRGIGYASWRMGRYEDSIRHYREALDGARRAGDEHLVGILKIDQGLLLETHGRYREALDSFDDAIDVLGKASDGYNLARAYNNSGEVYKDMGILEEAIRMYEDCLAVSEEEGNERMAGYALGNSAECYARLGKVRKAEEYAKRTLDIFKGRGDAYMVSGVHLTYGIMYTKMKDEKKMRRHFETAIGMLRELKFPYEIGTNTYEYARSLAELKLYKDARDKYYDALEIFIKIDSEQFIQRVSAELGNLPTQKMGL